MEKRVSYKEFQSVRYVARAVDPILTQRNRLQAQIDALDAEFQEKAKATVLKMKEAVEAKKARLTEKIDEHTVQIEALEAGIVKIFGLHVSDLVKKVIEPTGKTDKEGKPIKETNYIPTDIVSYDAENKQYVITLPDEEDTTVPPSTEGLAGSDFDIDAGVPSESSEVNEPEMSGSSWIDDNN